MLNELELLEIREAENFMYQEIDENEDKSRFKICNLEQANWAFRKIRAFKKQIEENEKLAKAEIERIQNWLKKENEKIQKSIEFFESLIGEYLIEQRKVDPKFKLSTPYGKATFRKQQLKWEYEEDKLVEWLESMGLNEMIRVVKEPIKNEVKKLAAQIKEGQVITEDGLIIEGVKVIEQPEKLVIEIND
ncbi:hypothetical protein Calow_0816 [Caldicellulosiruptor owensensis OL]|uniref:Bacteriophage Mu Gam like protein n=1 Tax=Caldicellulosiruptor owensensis (strain ATCC 700167 / DSM 13100 / OL) TaxID=632518 RepID=E4Q610_CALOW|nr:host-nuclease inhibitor Gam family protein [Caldicellulosiruptor owensensis]ADQ04384.1 hypothetical protein Calow_0816 [Caldicellulosiruptor owensensis OL]